MQYPVILKLILRSWWRNKLFASISLLSLAIGITCTILLISFVTYEYTIESSNPRKEDIFRLTQNVPVMQKQKQGTFVYGGSVPDIVSQFPEIESYLRMNELQTSGIRVGNEKFDKQTIVKADSSLLHFFPFETVYGNLPEVLSHPGQVAISEKLARLYFGNENYENRTITLELPDTIYTVQVTAVFRHYPQAMLQADILTSLSDPEQGSSCMILLKKKSSQPHFVNDLKKQDCLL
ncbi:ABC transporter permease [Bacteroides hominis]|uniref:ABC transporter permease n=1 Tax=Bacteroides hominis TaxID=2763023 RepID=UPI00220A3166|nr:ABC transporter permease [Bacteroides fragilis]MCS2597069.1 ABC transporter permease [Bacteroides fragilis]MCS2832123.1 ABC transporter permease [Bacteroides fragilis]MCS3147031.1 ABC transporter permease [Bacteroides fragilis]UVR98857.1 ABC transporter permease [Bacteroides fragilis]